MPEYNVDRLRELKTQRRVPALYYREALDWAIAEIERQAAITPDLRSTLERGDDIEQDFFRLKAQEWAMEPQQAEEIIRRRLKDAALE